ncbi:hypothetical protein DM02DRAFT_662851 [Periconia macrospinosa]|uniref:Uncharacterized protein n=1 Tax=Periconia macrospinosa TaxID=97972 RepID=A0A2V1D3G4_9PLEO|nr:hypothetical protein DM02DRAFT_662851 [Periconia macrospinosa]
MPPPTDKIPGVASAELPSIGEGQIIRVDEIALNDRKLEEKAKELSGEDLIIDAQETIGKPFQRIDRPVRAILIRIHSDTGLIRIYGRSIRVVATGPDRGVGFAMAVVRPDEDTIVHGHPSMRFFHQRR